ncbi:hypothetical protein VTN02DRAFT_4593 [Thermoascus thermophilus]
MPPRTIALVTSSTRSPRLNPFITDYIHDVLTPVLPDDVSLQILDVAAQDLPLYDEPAIPALLPATDPTAHYRHEHTRAWSSRVRQHDAFIFVTPQYNWSVPAGLKNALDYLFHEWTGKPAGIVSYGGHGGGKAAGHLRDILLGLRMRPVSTAPALATTRTMLEDCLEQGRVGEAQIVAWREAGVEDAVRRMFEEILASLPECEVSN